MTNILRGHFVFKVYRKIYGFTIYRHVIHISIPVASNLNLNIRIKNIFYMNVF